MAPQLLISILYDFMLNHQQLLTKTTLISFIIRTRTVKGKKYLIAIQTFHVAVET